MTRQRILRRCWLFVAPAWVLLATACAGGTAHPVSNSAASAHEDSAPGLHTYLCSDDSSALLLQWTGDRRISGTALDTEVTGSAPSLTMQTQTLSLRGTTRSETLSIRF